MAQRDGSGVDRGAPASHHDGVDDARAEEARLTARRWVENRPIDRRPRLDFAELWAYRELVGFFALRDLKVRYKQAVLGAAWAVLQPIAGAAVFTFVFRRLADLPSDGVPYPVFAFVGISVWSYFTASVNGATGSLVLNASVVTKVYFPRVVAPLAAVLPPLADLGVAMVVLVGFMVVYEVTPGIAALAVPLVILLLTVTALAVGLSLSALNVRYRDVRSVFALLLQLWLFASPVAYPTSLVPPGWRWVYAVNPMVGVLDTFRWAALGTDSMGGHVLVSLSSLVVLLWIGVRVFARGERRFADVI